MAGINWSDQALDDLDAICDFIARDAPHYAQVFANRVFESVERLEMFPQSGRIVPELQLEMMREIIWKLSYCLQIKERRSRSPDSISCRKTF